MNVIDYKAEDGKTKIFYKEFQTHETRSIIVDMTFTEFHAAFTKWRHGDLIQNCFPRLTPDQREIMMTGIDGAAWDKMFSFSE